MGTWACSSPSTPLQLLQRKWKVMRVEIKLNPQSETQAFDLDTPEKIKQREETVQKGLEFMDFKANGILEVKNGQRKWEWDGKQPQLIIKGIEGKADSKVKIEKIEATELVLLDDSSPALSIKLSLKPA
ncbi:MAG TPA: hypothetical protein DCM08_01725 [Microscillaceae bacterium]|jgi:hypothetical protein|nr:hypothetical protein [Microscillaceae bacterium]